MSPATLATFPPGPRQAECVNKQAWFLLWFPRLFGVPHMLVGVGLLVAMLGSLLWLLLGTNSEAEVVRTWTTRSKGVPTCHVAWRQLRAGQPLLGDATVACEHQAELSRPGAVVPLRVLQVGPLRHAALWLPLASPWDLVVFPWLFGLFWNAGVGIFAWSVYVVPTRQRRLVETGLATQGTVTRKYTRTRKTTHYLLDYRYQPPGSPPQTGTATANDREPWDAVKEGDPLVILYAPEAPSRSVAYDHCPFRVR